MFEKAIGLRGEFEKDVEVFTQTGHMVGQGSLKISPNKIPRVESHLFGVNFSTEEHILIVETATKQRMTLIGCENYGGEITPTIIVQSDQHSGSFSHFSFVLQGLFEWMDDSMIADQDLMNGNTQNTVSKALNQRKFNVNINDSENRAMRISSENIANVKKEKNVYTITQNILIKCEYKDATLSASETIAKAHEIKNIFSLLLGHPLSIEYAFDNSTKRKKEIYFGNNQADPQAFHHDIDCIIPAGILDKDNRWETIFKTALCTKREMFLNLWSRLPNITGFSKFWEYELLACVSLIDLYCTIQCNANDVSISRSSFDRLTKHLRKSLDEFSDEKNHDDFMAIKPSLKKQIINLQNTMFSSFKDSFDFTVKNISSDFYDILDFTKDDFKHMKSIRNNIAHGDIPKTRSGTDITYEYTLHRKLHLLLFYWMYQDLGFSEKEIIFYISNSMHSTIRSADLNQISLDKTLNRYPFMDISKDDLDLIGTGFRVVLECTENQYRVRKDLSEKIKSWPSKKSEKRDLNEYLASLITDGEAETVTYMNFAYVQHEEELKKISDVCLINSRIEMKGYSRRLTFNKDTSVWENS